MYPLLGKLTDSWLMTQKMSGTCCIGAGKETKILMMKFEGLGSYDRTIDWFKFNWWG